MKNMKKMLFSAVLASLLVIGSGTRVHAVEFPAIAIPATVGVALGVAGLGAFDKAGAPSGYLKRAACVASSAALLALCYYMYQQNGFVLNGTNNLNDVGGCLKSGKLSLDAFSISLDAFSKYMATSPFVKKMAVSAGSYLNTVRDSMVNLLDPARQANKVYVEAMGICENNYGGLSWFTRSTSDFYKCAENARIALNAALKK